METILLSFHSWLGYDRMKSGGELVIGGFPRSHCFSSRQSIVLLLSFGKGQIIPIVLNTIVNVILIIDLS